MHISLTFTFYRLENKMKQNNTDANNHITKKLVFDEEDSLEDDYGSDDELAKDLCARLNLIDIGVETKINHGDLLDRPQLIHMLDEAPAIEHEEENVTENDVEDNIDGRSETPTEKRKKYSIVHEYIVNRKAVFVSLDLETGGDSCGVIQLSAEIFQVSEDLSGYTRQNEIFDKYVKPSECAVWSQSAINIHGLHAGHKNIVSADSVVGSTARIGDNTEIGGPPQRIISCSRRDRRQLEFANFSHPS